MDPEFGRDGEESQIATFTSTFSLSNTTNFDTLRRAACLYWGVMLNDFQLYFVDEKGGIQDLGQESGKIMRYLETYASTNTMTEAETKAAEAAKKKGKKVPKKVSYAKFYLGRINRVANPGDNLDKSLFTV